MQYAGSLNGGDFRIILQVAPSMLHGLIPDAAYEAWLALCTLAPLLFQPEIDDLDGYLVRYNPQVCLCYTKCDFCSVGAARECH